MKNGAAVQIVTPGGRSTCNGQREREAAFLFTTPKSAIMVRGESGTLQVRIRRPLE